MHTLKNYDFLVVGAGLFGAVFAHEMTSAGKRVLVVERRNNIGGNIYTEKYNGVIVHKYGAHIFHTNKKKVWDYVNDKHPLTPIFHSPLARTETGKLLHLPFCLNTFNGLWPDVVTPAMARKKIKEQTAKWAALYPKPETLEQKALTMVGGDIYDELIRGYSEKQWGRKCRELPAETITRLPLRYTWNASYFDDAFVGVPKDGYTPLVEKLLEGVDVITGVDYLKERGRFDGIAERVLYTGAIDEYYGYALGSLEYRSLRFGTKIEGTDSSQGCSVINYTGNDVPYTRCIEHNQFSIGEYNEEIVKSYEYPTEYVAGSEEPYYPIVTAQNKMLYNMYAALAKNSNVIFGGRLGMYQYMDMDDAIESAIRLSSYYK